MLSPFFLCILISMMHDQNVPRKANHILHLFLIALMLMLVRVWYLSAIKHDHYLEKARKPQRRMVVEPAYRGTIRDRFNLPLAINKIQYNAAIRYDRIREIPTTSWRTSEEGKRIKVYERREHIHHLAQFLAHKLEMDPVEIEDIIYSKAAIFPNTPFVIRENIPETLYYELRFAEKDWTGLETERASKRFYPQGKVASDIIGYLGAIDERLYYEIANEIEELNTYLQHREEGIPVPLPKGFRSAFEVQSRLSELKEKAYTIHAQVGRTGIERKYDEKLRGLFGKRQVEIGAKGRFLRNLPGSSEAISGQRILLTLSSELQQYAENLLIENEKERDQYFALAGKDHDTIAPPWIKGGAIVAMLPDTGEVVALASYPRFDSNDFIKRDLSSIYKWLESPQHLAAIWNGKSPLERENLSANERDTYQEEVFLSWDFYLDQILSKNCAVRKQLKDVQNISQAIHIEQLALGLLKLGLEEDLPLLIDTLYLEAAGHIPSHITIEEDKRQALRERLEEQSELFTHMRNELDVFLKPIKHNDDKLLFLDLLRLAVDEKRFSKELIEQVGTLSLEEYTKLTQAGGALKETVREEVQKLHHERLFPLWRKQNFKPYLQAKREEEKEKRTYAHPYCEYLAEAESKLFETFWEENKDLFIQTYLFGNQSSSKSLQPFLFHLTLKGKEALSNELILLKNFLKPLSFETRQNFLATLRTFYELKEPLWGHYYGLYKSRKEATLKDLAAAFYPKTGFGYGKSYAYSQATPLGSLFKLVTGYEALKQTFDSRTENHLSTHDLNPLTIYDEMNPNIVTENGIVLGRMLDGTWITRHYKGGRMPRSHANLGRVDFFTAIERSSNVYFSLLASEIIQHPTDLYYTTKNFGFGARTGIDLIGEIAGYVPDDIRDSRTGLYAFAIGQHSLEVTPLQSTLMLAAIANGGDVLTPQIVKMRAGIAFSNESEQLFSTSHFPYQSYLETIGIHFPLFTETRKVREKTLIEPFSKEIKQTLAFPHEVRSTLLESMRRVVWGEKGPAQPYRIRTLYQHPKWIAGYKKLKNQFIGKTSTAEYVYRPTLDRENPPLLCKDIWFGSIAFEPDKELSEAKPELVVVVYLRFGNYGKEAAPLAAQVVKKWREINSLVR